MASFGVFKSGVSCRLGGISRIVIHRILQVEIVVQTDAAVYAVYVDSADQVIAVSVVSGE